MQPQDAVYPSLLDQPVFVTGGASGIGASIVRHFAAQGSRVAFVDIQREAGAALADEIAAAGHPRPLFLPCDLTDIPALQAAVAQGAAALGRFTTLVNNAAHDDRHDWRRVTVEYWEERLAVNLRHQFFAIQAIAPLMIAAGRGSIINFGSVSWRVATGGMPAYPTSKAGVEGLTRSFARDLGGHGIRVNCVSPGWIMTERQRALWVTPEAEKNTLDLQCLKALLYPADLARMVLWLAAEDSRMCTAHTWHVDAGRG